MPLLNTKQNAVHILRKTIMGNLQPIVVANFEVNNVSGNTDGTAKTANSPMELSFLLSESSFQPEHSKKKHSIVLQDAHILHEAKDGLSS